MLSYYKESITSAATNRIRVYSERHWHGGTDGNEVYYIIDQIHNKTYAKRSAYVTTYKRYVKGCKKLSSVKKYKLCNEAELSKQ